MFDQHSYHHTTRVTQQPNDAADAARLYGELKKKSEQEIANVARTADNQFQAVIHQQQEMMSGFTYLKAHYTLNGRRLTDEAKYDTYMEKPEDGLKRLHEEMSKTIAVEVLQDALRGMEGRFIV